MVSNGDGIDALLVVGKKSTVYAIEGFLEGIITCQRVVESAKVENCCSLSSRRAFQISVYLLRSAQRRKFIRSRNFSPTDILVTQNLNLIKKNRNRSERGGRNNPSVSCPWLCFFTST